MKCLNNLNEDIRPPDYSETLPSTSDKHTHCVRAVAEEPWRLNVSEQKHQTTAITSVRAPCCVLGTLVLGTLGLGTLVLGMCL